MSAEKLESKEARRERILGVDREVPCTVFPGLFSSEIGVLIELPDGQNIGGFFNELYASWVGELTEEGVDGRFGVYTLEEDGGEAVIRFTTNSGQHLLNCPSVARVPKDFLLPKAEVDAIN